jgi:hypothetical protein
VLLEQRLRKEAERRQLKEEVKGTWNRALKGDDTW